MGKAATVEHNECIQIASYNMGLTCYLLANILPVKFLPLYTSLFNCSQLVLVLGLLEVVFSRACLW